MITMPTQYAVPGVNNRGKHYIQNKEAGGTGNMQMWRNATSQQSLLNCLCRQSLALVGTQVVKYDCESGLKVLIPVLNTPENGDPYPHKLQ